MTRPIRRAGLMARHTIPDAVSTLAQAAAWLAGHGCEPVVDAASAVPAAAFDRWERVDRDALAGSVDVLIAFGGDGTLLEAAGVVARSAADVPLLGVNLGRLGFLTEVGRAELVPALEALLSGRTRTEDRLMLAGVVERGQDLVEDRIALNDVVVTRGPLSRMIEIDVAVDDQFVCHVKADGVIIATATGSTAYNLSAGGPIVHPSVDALVLTPIAPHTLTNRPIVLPAAAQVTLRPAPDSEPSDLVATFDGQFGVALTDRDLFTIRRADRVLRLLRTTARTHFDMLREKLKWGGA